MPKNGIHVVALVRQPVLFYIFYSVVGRLKSSNFISMYVLGTVFSGKMCTFGCNECHLHVCFIYLNAKKLAFDYETDEICTF